MTGETITPPPELTLAEPQVLMRQVQDATRAAIERDRDAYQARFSNIDAAVGAIEALLGPKDGPAYIPGGTIPATIRSVGAHDPATLAQHSGLALDLILAGMEVLAAATLDALVIVSRELKGRERY